MDKLSTLLRAVVETYPDDSVKPGVSLAFIRVGSFYASVARYDTYGAKSVVVSAYGATTETALDNLAKGWLKFTDRAPVTARDQLRAAL